MNKEEFKKFVLAEAMKYLNEDVKKAKEEGLNKDSKLDDVGKEDADVNNDGKVDSTDDYLKNRREKISTSIKDKKDLEEEITPSQIAQLAEEIKQLNKSFDFRNPVVVAKESVPETVIKEGVEIPVKKEEKSIFSEQKSQWKNLLDYKVPSDEDRKNYK